MEQNQKEQTSTINKKWICGKWNVYSENPQTGFIKHANHKIIDIENEISIVGSNEKYKYSFEDRTQMLTVFYNETEVKLYLGILNSGVAKFYEDKNGDYDLLLTSYLK